MITRMIQTTGRRKKRVRSMLLSGAAAPGPSYPSRPLTAPDPLCRRDVDTASRSMAPVDARDAFDGTPWVTDSRGSAWAARTRCSQQTLSEDTRRQPRA